MDSFFYQFAESDLVLTITLLHSTIYFVFMTVTEHIHCLCSTFSMNSSLIKQTRLDLNLPIKYGFVTLYKYVIKEIILINVLNFQFFDDDIPRAKPYGCYYLTA